VAALLLCLAPHPASAQTLGGACTTAAGYSADQISIVKNNVAVCTQAASGRASSALPPPIQTTASPRGANSLSNVTTGTYNTALGTSAMAGISATPLTGNYNTAVGDSALFQIQGMAADNTALGYQAGYDLTSGAQNIIIGYYPTTGVGITTGSNNILIGQNLQELTNTSSNQLDIGNLIFATGLGSGSTMSTGSVGIGTRNMRRLGHLVLGGLIHFFARRPFHTLCLIISSDPVTGRGTFRTAEITPPSQL
jgi:hypothetical protein